jgi:ribosomal protein S18 acetylase RimI-like enzyme
MVIVSSVRNEAETLSCENSMVKVDYEVRPAILTDIEAIAAFQTSCWRESYRGLVPDEYLDHVTEADRAIRWRERLISGSREIAIGWAAAEIAGVVSWGNPEDGSRLLELKSLYVDKNHRGSGLATTLTNRAVGDAAAQLWVFEQNLRARTFYQKVGFAPDGSIHIDPDTGVPEIRMIRRSVPSV